MENSACWETWPVMACVWSTDIHSISKSQNLACFQLPILVKRNGTENHPFSPIRDCLRKPLVRMWPFSVRFNMWWTRQGKHGWKWGQFWLFFFDVHVMEKMHFQAIKGCFVTISGISPAGFPTWAQNSGFISTWNRCAPAVSQLLLGDAILLSPKKVHTLFLQKALEFQGWASWRGKTCENGCQSENFMKILSIHSTPIHSFFPLS